MFTLRTDLPFGRPVATLTRARRLRPDYHQARLTMLSDQLAGLSG